MSLPSRSKRASRRDVHLDVGVAGEAADRCRRGPRRGCGSAGRRGSRPGSRPRAPFASIVRPFPLHALQGVSTTVPAPSAGRAGLGADELAEDAPRDLLHLARAAAGLAGDALGPGLGAVPVADARTWPRPRPRRVRSTPVNASASSIATATPTSPPRARPPRLRAEEVVAEEGGEDVAQVREGRSRSARSRRAGGRRGRTVVELAPLGVREHLVGLGDRAEALLRVRRRRSRPGAARARACGTPS